MKALQAFIHQVSPLFNAFSPPLAHQIGEPLATKQAHVTEGLCGLLSTQQDHGHEALIGTEGLCSLQASQVELTRSQILTVTVSYSLVI